MGCELEMKRKRRHNCCFNGGVINSVKKLQMREISSRTNRRRFNFAQERFRNYQLQEEYDIYNSEEDCPSSLSFSSPRSKIIELFVAGGVIFALAKSGVCAAFSRETKKRLCFLNASPDEEIHSLFYNRKNDSLITLSGCVSDDFNELICRTTSIEYIQRGKPDAGYRLFESESIKWTGSVRFDDINEKILTHCAEDKIYKVFDLKNYTFLYSIVDKNIQEIEVSPGTLLLIYKRTRWGLPLKILSVEDGTVIGSFNHLLHKKKKVVFITQYTDKLIVKQEKQNLQIVDVRNSQITEVNRTEFLNMSTVILLYSQFLMTFTNHTVTLWDLRGQLVTLLEDHLLWHPNYNTNYLPNNVYVTRKGYFIISYCKADSNESSNGNGSINISNTLTGKCVGKITTSNSRNRIRASKIRSTVAEALVDVTALFYDEERDEIYTSNKLGGIHVWSN